MKNKIYTKLLDYDSLMHYLQNVDYDLMSDLMELSHNELLYFAVKGYEAYLKGEKNA